MRNLKWLALFGALVGCTAANESGPDEVEGETAQALSARPLPNSFGLGNVSICGAAGGACCADSSCLGADLECVAGTCAACGAVGGHACGGVTCYNGLPVNGTCVSCDELAISNLSAKAVSATVVTVSYLDPPPVPVTIVLKDRIAPGDVHPTTLAAGAVGRATFGVFSSSTYDVIVTPQSPVTSTAPNAQSACRSSTTTVTTPNAQDDNFKKNIALPAPPAHTPDEAASTFTARANALLQHRACNLNSDFRARKNNTREVAYPGETWSADALAMIAYSDPCPNLPNETRKNRSDDVSDALAAFESKDMLLGTSSDDLKPVWTRNGDLDTALKDLLPILYLYRDRLSPSAYDHMLTYFQNTDAGPATTEYDSWEMPKGWLEAGLAAGAILLPPPLSALDVAESLNIDKVTVDETENHRLLIYTTRYLANDLLYAAGRGEQYNNWHNGMRNWALTRLHNLLAQDFKEYNAKPYQRYSLDAIENLAELAKDDAVKTAARAVLDFVAAKYAVSSSMLRRNSPLRRKVDDDADNFFYSDPGDGKIMDEMSCRFALYAGNTDLMPPVVTSGVLGTLLPDGCEGITRQAMGSYRVPPMIIDLAQNKQRYTYFQTFAGTAEESRDPGNLEIYDNEGPFMIAGGGVKTGSGSALDIHHRVGSDALWPGTGHNDVGVSVLTAILPNSNDDSMDDRLRITDRTKTVNIDSGLCIAPGFACGTSPRVPPELLPFTVAKDRSGNVRPKQDWNNVPGWQFVNFKTFFVAVFTDIDANGAFGFVEAVPAAAFTGINSYMQFVDFQSKVISANGPSSTPVAHQGPFVLDVHYRSALGDSIEANYMLGSRTYPFRYARGRPLPSQNTDAWPLASGVINAAHDGDMLITVKRPAWPNPCELDLTNPAKPVRRNCDDPAKDPIIPGPHSAINWASVSVPTNVGYVFPTNALVSGGRGSLDEFVCRVTSEGIPRIGHFDRIDTCWAPAYTSTAGHVAKQYSNFDVLTYDGSNAYDTPRWLLPTDPNIATLAYVAGSDSSGRPIKVCRAMVNYAELPGELLTTGCWVPANGSLTKVDSYEVLSLISLNSPPPGDGLSMTLPTTSISLYQNGSTSLTVNTAGKPGALTLTVSGLPNGVTIKDNNGSSGPKVGPGSYLAFWAALNAPVGSFTATVTASANGFTASQKVLVEVDPCPVITTCGTDCGTISNGCGGTLSCPVTPQCTCESKGDDWVNNSCQPHKSCSTARECCLQDPDKSWINGKCQ